jgi:iron(III) transport system substrate-binding protein
VAGAAWAQDPPAVAAAAAGDREALRARIAAAKSEGSVVYWDAVVQPETNEALTAAFRKAHGLPTSFAVRYNLSATQALVTRVDQETASGNVTIDVASLASPPWVNGLVAGGHIARYDSPHYAAFAKAFEAGMGQPGYYAFNGAYMFIPGWNPDNFEFKGKSWRDVLGAVPAGRMSINDSANSATGLLTFIGLRAALGVDFFKDVAKMKPNFIVRSEQVVERLLSGQDLLAFGTTTGRVMQYNDKGARVKFLLPQEGIVLLGAGSFVLAKAPHPNAARLWLDFTLSEEGQTILTRKEALISGRSGFKSPLPEYAPSIDTLKLIKVDWLSMSQDDIRKAKAEWQGIFTP